MGIETILGRPYRVPAIHPTPVDRAPSQGAALEEQPPVEEPTPVGSVRTPWGKVPPIAMPTEIEPREGFGQVPAVQAPSESELDSILASVLGLPAALQKAAQAVVVPKGINVLGPWIGQMDMVYDRWTLNPDGESGDAQEWSIGPSDQTAAAVLTGLRFDVEPDAVEVELKGISDLATIGAVHSSGTHLYLRRDVLDRDLLAQLGGFVIVPAGSTLTVVISNTTAYEIVISASVIRYRLDPKYAQKLALLRSGWQEV